jgi:endonuclease/exonuclease/phosphatase family metal-dependent hydrolase
MNRLRVLTLNIWNRQGPWDQRLELIRAGIRALDPDLVGLQEVFERDGHSQAHEIAAGLGLGVGFGQAHDFGGGFHFGNAVLSRWPVASLTVLPLPVGDADEQRSLLCAEIEAPLGRIPFYTTHLNWKYHHGVVRERQVVAIAAHIEEAASAHALPAVLVGDFNAEPDAAEIRFLKGLQSLEGRSTYFTDAFALTGAGPGFTYDVTRNPFAAPAHEPPRRIDYVFAREPDTRGRGRPLHARVVLEEVHGGVAATDHYGVYAEISI